MSAAIRAVDELVARVLAEVGDAADPTRLRLVFERVLDQLEVRASDPAWSDGRDIVGAAYERLLSGRERRALGQFFTPLSVGRAMAHWLLAAHPRLLLDPGCGSGSLLAAAQRERTGSTRMLGLDVDPLAITMAKKNAALRSINDLDVRQANFLTDEIPERPQAIICNPPYTRHQALASAEKRAIHSSLRRRLDVEFSQLASLHVLFLVRALDLAAEEARLAFITPAHWLDMNYARRVKELVLKTAHVEAIIELPASELVFEHAITTATITLIRKGVGDKTPTRLLRARSAERDEIVTLIDDPDAGTAVKLSSAQKWSRKTRRVSKQGVPLGDVAHIRRGAATGHNSFFVLSDEERRRHGLSRCLLRPCITSPRLFDGDELDEAALSTFPDTAPRWLLAASRERRGGPLERYLLRADDLGVRDRYLVKQRVKAGRPWWQVEADFAAPILFSYFNRHRARFIRNRADAVPLNNWLAIQPHEGIDSDRLHVVLLNARVSAQLADHARHYGNGLWKLEPSELKQVLLNCDSDCLRSG